MTANPARDPSSTRTPVRQRARRRGPGTARRRTWRAAAATAAALVAVPLASAPGLAAQDPPGGPPSSGPVVPADPQRWEDQASMTWDDYVPVRPDEWASAATSQGSEVQYRTAVILLEFTDQPMLVTQEPGSHPFGNPQEGFEPVPADQVDDWYLDYFTVPSERNGFQTLHSYWMEDSHGKIGVDAEVFGAFRLPGKLHEYGIDDRMNGPIEQFCPQGDECGKNLRADGMALWRDAIGCTTDDFCGFDNVFIVTAGHDESSTWEEFGQMRFADKEDVPDELGPPRNADGSPVLNQLGEPMTNWASTRYVDWTSWRAAANHWPNAGGGISTQAESSGLSVFAHEFSHLRGLPDNYNNPFADDTRNFTGYWEMMSRGTFNGPGGTHQRWQVPNAGGSGLGPHHMVHYKQDLGVLTDAMTVQLTRSGLAEDGVAVATLRSREHVPDDGDKVALDLDVDGGWTAGACEDQVGAVTDDAAFWCPDGTGWQDYTMEVVDRVGNDSFAPGHGVLLAQNQSKGSPREWLVDANPQDIDRVDYVGPDGQDVMVVRGDPRQLDDATFHAGTGSGSVSEWVDEPNRLHLYVLDAYRDRDGVLSYDVAARSLDGSGDQERDGRLGRARTAPVGGGTALVTSRLANTGEAGDGVHGSDVYRLSATVDGEGWDVTLPYELTAVEAGDAEPVAAYATAGDGAARSATVTITATSESDPDVVTTTTVTLTRHDLRVTPGSTARLVGDYAVQGVLTRGESARLLTQVGLAATLPPRAADKALDRFQRFAADVASEGRRNLASAALVSAAQDLRR
ncbi:M6 family metalloprotease domain-containing protein [Isoptericola sp. NPDC057391]|uniref:M6 family metalloprotease domain-containing protein n=1 Tax=Isoptericola sp. NPDC057391 TaxID=3346117 RepID=UPI00363BBE60